MPSRESQPRGIPSMLIALRTQLLACLVAGLCAGAPALAIWPGFGGGPESDGTTATAVDATGDVYAIGNFRGTAYFGDKELHAHGSTDVFVVRYNPDGGVIWAASAGGLLPDGGYDIVVDSAKNAYVIGYFIEGMVFEDDEDAFNPILDPLELGRPTSLGRDWFIAKIGADGIWQWARQVGANGSSLNQTGYAIALAPPVEDPADPLPAGVVAAGFGGCSDIAREDGTQINVSCDGKPIKVYRLDTDGEWTWTLSGGNAGPLWISDLAIDASGQVYVTGSFLANNSLETQPSATTLTFAGVPAGGTLQFQHRFNFDTPASCYDGGVLEYSTNSGADWYDILSGLADNDPTSTADVPRFLLGEYNGTLNGAESNPLGVRPAYCYGSGGYQQVSVDLSGFAGLSTRFRWRLGTGFQIGAEGWSVDDVVVVDGVGQVLFSDDIEAGGGNFSLSGSAGASPWSISTSQSSSPTHSWVVPDGTGVSDQILAMNRSSAMPDPIPSMFVAKIGGAETAFPFWAWAAPLPAGATAGGLATNGSGGVFIGGTTRSALSSFGGVNITTMGAYAARLTDLGTSYAWQWARGASGGDASSLVLLPGNGDLVIAGTYTGSPLFNDVQVDPLNPGLGTGPQPLPAADGTDVFVARVAGSGTTWRWVTLAGDLTDELLPVPSPGFERGTAVSTSPDGTQLYVGGSFDNSATFGTIPIASLGATDAFVANLAAGNGDWFFINFQKRVVGAEVLPPLPPEQLCLTHPALSLPTIEIQGPGQAIPDYFHWTPPGVVDSRGHLYAVQPVNATVSWKKNAACPFDNNDRADSPGATDWPRESDGDIRYCGSDDADLHAGEPCVQLHIAGAPADIEPAPAGDLLRIHRAAARGGNERRRGRRSGRSWPGSVQRIQPRLQRAALRRRPGLAQPRAGCGGDSRRRDRAVRHAAPDRRCGGLHRRRGLHDRPGDQRDQPL